MWIILFIRWGNANVETQSFVSRVAQPQRVTHTREKCNNLNEEGFIIAKGAINVNHKHVSRACVITS